MPSSHRRGKKPTQSETANTLFPLPPESPAEPKIDQLRIPVWTKNKAKLIERYLYHFVLITKHGTYIDGFAGPQQPSHPEMWAAKLVLDSEPRLLRHFYLFDKKKEQVKRLADLKKAQPQLKDRSIRIFHGDFNEEIRPLLHRNAIRKTEATFCLIDQRTFQCHWETLVNLAKYKAAEKWKIELFYFLAVGWLPRALSAVRNTSLLEKWWGRDDWSRLKGMPAQQVKNEIVSRFKSELGYKSAKPWPIYERQGSSVIMYYMIHATDHDEAPKLMNRAYHLAVQPKETPEQFKLIFEAGLKDES
jgi:three-Cys-motif partner protein